MYLGAGSQSMLGSVNLYYWKNGNCVFNFLDVLDLLDFIEI